MFFQRKNGLVEFPCLFLENPILEIEVEKAKAVTEKKRENG